MDIDKVLDTIFDEIGKTADNAVESLSNTKLFQKYKNADDPIESILDDAGKAVTAAYDRFSKASKPTVENVRQKTYNALYERYRKAGEPYGAGEEGYRRWIAEKENKFRADTITAAGKAGNEVKKGYNTVRNTIKNQMGKTR